MARLGVVIPTLDEEEALPKLLEDLAHLTVPVEIVVADGGSRDATERVARRGSARWVSAKRGRARQMNAGAAALRTPWLLFLHADSRVPPETRAALERWISNPLPCEAAHFAFRLHDGGPWWTVVEWGQRLRERLTGLVYGDQGLLISRVRFDEVGGVPELPLMEDVEIVRRLRRGPGIHRIDAPILTSARRYHEEGRILASLRNAALISLYIAGVSSRHLARWYRPRRALAPATAAPESSG